MTTVHPRWGDSDPSAQVQDGAMSDKGARLDRAEHDIDQAQAILDKVEQVLQLVGKVDAAPRGRALLRTAAILIAGGVALAGLAVVIGLKNASSSSSTPTSSAPAAPTGSAT